MVAGSILPVSIHDNKLYFLFGKENPLEDSAKGWSDFGGGLEKGETPFQTALREGGEELTGFLGNGKQLAKHIKKHGGTYHIENNKYHSHLFFFPYDENLVKYYNQNHTFLWERMDHHLLKKTKLFEKIEIGWFSIDDMKRRKSEFRSFYQTLVDMIIMEEPKIRSFIDKCANTKIQNKHRKTQKLNQ